MERLVKIPISLARQIESRLQFTNGVVRNQLSQSLAEYDMKLQEPTRIGLRSAIAIAEAEAIADAEK